MQLYSFAFFLFVIIFVIIHEIFGKLNSKNQWIIRLIASICFYIWLAKLRVIFLIISVASVWAAGLIMNSISEKGKLMRKAEGLTREDKKLIKQKTQNKKRFILFATLILNLGILAAVKYILPLVSTSKFLPLGISFYTFMAIAYLIDIYGEKYEVQRSLPRFALYISWFPQMIQGPINRYDSIEEDLYGHKSLSWECWKSCMLLYLFGALKKYAIADILTPSVTAILGGDVSALPGSYLLFGAFLYAISQYADFSGGIDMVMAVSMLFGVKMADNFKQPYFSKSIAEFWRRWHISLGQWMRDYVFYPFAMLKPVQNLTNNASKKWGNHWGRAITGGIGNLLVFLLVGLWHGPQLHFIVWGLYNGCIIAASDCLAPTFTRWKQALSIEDTSKPYQLFQIIRTFIIIVFAGYFDIVEGLRNGLICFKNTFLHFGAARFSDCITYLENDPAFSLRGFIILLIGLAIVLTSSIMKENKLSPIEWIGKRNIFIRWSLYYLMIFTLLLSFTLIGDGGNFMYAAF